MWESRVPFLVWEDPLEKEMATHSSTVLKNRLIQQVVLRASFAALSGRNLPAMQQTWVRFLGWEDPLGEGKDYPLRYSGLENSMDCIVHGVAKSQTRLSNFHFLHFHTNCKAVSKLPNGVFWDSYSGNYSGLHIHTHTHTHTQRFSLFDPVILL